MPQPRSLQRPLLTVSIFSFSTLISTFSVHLAAMLGRVRRFCQPALTSNTRVPYSSVNNRSFHPTRRVETEDYLQDCKHNQRVIKVYANYESQSD